MMEEYTYEGKISYIFSSPHKFIISLYQIKNPKNKVVGFYRNVRAKEA
jgi:hypothetical protein